jgi:hypothetical protein
MEGLYAEWFKEARDAYQIGNYSDCIQKAKHLLTDPTLPRYVSIKTCMLIAYATDDWDDAEHRMKPTALLLPPLTLDR